MKSKLIKYLVFLLNVTNIFNCGALQKISKAKALKSAILYEGIIGVGLLLPKLCIKDLYWKDETALHCAIRKHAERQIITKLIEKDSNLLKVLNKNDETPFIVALNLNHSLVCFLVQFYENHSKEGLDQKTLHMLVMQKLHIDYGKMFPEDEEDADDFESDKEMKTIVTYFDNRKKSKTIKKRPKKTKQIYRCDNNDLSDKENKNSEEKLISKSTGRRYVLKEQLVLLGVKNRKIAYT